MNITHVDILIVAGIYTLVTFAPIIYNYTSLRAWLASGALCTAAIVAMLVGSIEIGGREQSFWQKLEDGDYLSEHNGMIKQILIDYGPLYMRSVHWLSPESPEARTLRKNTWFDTTKYYRSLGGGKMEQLETQSPDS